jgi:hypothetical protein
MAMPKCLALIVLACSIAGQALADGALVHRLTPQENRRLERIDSSRAAALAVARTRGAQGIGDAAPSSWVSQQGC